MQPPTKHCVECHASFNRPPNRSHKQWAKMQCCSPRCANTLRARGHTRQPGDLSLKHGKAAYQLAWQQRKAMPYWAAWWEDKRRAQDQADLTTTPTVYGKGAQVIAKQQPSPRLFIGRACQACGAMWVSYSAMPDTIYCKPCNRARWRETHYERALRYELQFDVIDPVSIFERDRWRCQICGRKTIKKWGSPRSATIDHIIPMADPSAAGHHTRENLQCACAACNARKGSRAANDQLRLLG